MAGKKYADYSIDLFNAYGRFIKLDTASARKVIGQIEEVAKKTGSWEWKLEAEYFEMELFDIKRTLYGDGLFPVQVLVQKAQALLDQTQKWKVLPLELAVRQRISEFYWNYLKNYEWAFELYNVQEKRLQNVSLENIPEILDFYMKIATAHYFFADYPKAASLFKIVLEGADNSRTRFSQQHARNGLGLINRIYDDLDRSDSCFLAMIASCNLVQDGAFFTDNWNGMAEGNLGHNLLLRGAFDQAIPLLKSSIEKMVKWEDYAFAAGSVLDLANIWLQKGMLPQSKQSIDLALDYYHRIPREGLLSQIYETLNKYYAAVGKGKLSMAYMDSTQAENKKHQARFSALQLMRVAQRQHLSEQKLKEEQLIAAKIKSDGFKRSLMISCIALVLIGSVLVRYFML
ncbi:MAG: hypothetical protein FWG54_00710, partial [Bacteroidetes bacterium]|nr:hypothetical protein [Bacteroidota bacterium]